MDIDANAVVVTMETEMKTDKTATTITINTITTGLTTKTTTIIVVVVVVSSVVILFIVHYGQKLSSCVGRFHASFS